MTKLIILVGLPGSGKSTYGKELASKLENTVYYSSDSIRQELYGDENIQGDANKIFRIMHHRTVSSLKEGLNVIYDATNVNRKNRKSIIEAVLPINVKIEAHVVWAPIETCIQRDANRNRTVGKDVIYKFLYRWQSPFYDEHIDTIKIIHNVDQGFSANEYVMQIMEACKIPHDNPHHSLNIYEHMMAAWNYATTNFTSIEVLEAARYHDIGKPLTKIFKQHPDESSPVAHFYQHECIGAYLVYGIYPESLQELPLISWLVSTHMEPYFNSNYYKSKKDSVIGLMLDQLHECDVNSH